MRHVDFRIDNWPAEAVSDFMSIAESMLTSEWGSVNGIQLEERHGIIRVRNMEHEPINVEKLAWTMGHIMAHHELPGLVSFEWTERRGDDRFGRFGGMAVASAKGVMAKTADEIVDDMLEELGVVSADSPSIR